MKEKLNCILLIDDDLPTNVYNRVMVTESEVTERVEVRNSGEDALAFLTALEDGKYPNPAMIFVDVNMPGMDGWEFLEQYNLLTEEQKDNVVLMLTTSIDPIDKQKSIDLGAKGFIQKPLSSELIIELAKEHFPHKF
ncbi:response regulator [Bacteroidota bacterium]